MNCSQRIWVGVAFFCLVILTACTASIQKASVPGKNLIIMVPDGCSQSIQTLGRWYKGAPLHLDGLNSGSAKTFMANSVITGSAAAATAFATGHKTTARFVGIGPRTHDLLTGFQPTAAPYEPVASILEAAKLQGKSVGLVATSHISHATPAAFASHVHDRGMDNDIMEQLVYQDIDVVFGGGARYLIPEGTHYTTTFGHLWQGKRSDGEDLMAALQHRGYLWVDHKAGLEAVTHGPVWGLFDDSHLDPHMDRPALHPSQPTLADMTTKAIEILSKNPNGFFLLVESSQVDWAGHAMDAAYMVNEFLAFDAAVGRALAFAEEEGHTNLYIWPDHNTGGLSLGNYASFFNPGYPLKEDDRPLYTATTIEDLVAPLKKMRISAFALAEKIDNPNSGRAIKQALSQYWGINASDKDIQEILTAKAKKTNAHSTMGLTYAIAEVIHRNHTLLGWHSHGHHGDDVPVWSYGPDRLIGTFDNTDLAQQSAQALGVDLAQTTNRLFVDMAHAFPGLMLEGSDTVNPFITLGPHISIPLNKDILRIGTTEHRLDGVVVHAPRAGRGAGKVFIPQDAVARIKKELE